MQNEKIDSGRNSGKKRYLKKKRHSGKENIDSEKRIMDKIHSGKKFKQ